MSDAQENLDATPSRRVINACRRCRQRKVKCSGIQPCNHCERRRQPCIFDESERKVVISERRLRELQQRASGATRTHQQTPQRALPQLDSDNGVELPQRPQETVDSGRVKGSEWTSIWAFCKNARRALVPERYDEDFREQGNQRTTYAFSTEIELSKQPPRFIVPSKSFVSHLAQVCDFHLNGSYVLFDTPAFQEQLNRGEMSLSPQHVSIWHVKVLAIVALGRLLLEKGATPFGPPGIRDFLQAVSLLPSNIHLGRDPLAAIETLCLLAVYAQAADIHNAAYLYISQASRLAHCVDSWRHVGSVNSDDDKGAKHHRWTVSLLDQKLAATVGVNLDNQPLGLDEAAMSSDEQFSNATESPVQAHLCVAGFMSKVTAVMCSYSNGKVANDVFIAKTSSQLVEAHRLGQLLSSSYQICQENSITSVSRSIATLHLSYCQAVLLCTRPFLLDAVAFNFHRSHSLTASLDSVLALNILRTCVCTATHCLNVILALREQGILETFMFTDLEATFTSTLSLLIANASLPNVIDPLFLSTGKEVLQDMSRTGSLPARTLLMELEEICGLVTDLSMTQEASSWTRSETPVRMSLDGQALNDALASLINTEGLEARYSSIGHSQLQYCTTNILLHPQDPPLDDGAQLAANLDPTLMPTMASDRNSIAQSQDFHLENFGAPEMQLDLDLTNSSWLDFM